MEKNNVNYLAGVREIGIRSEYTDGRDIPRLLVRSIEFEGPFYESWPPASHRRITDPGRGFRRAEQAAEAIITRFASRAYRRPIRPKELADLLAIWRESHQADKTPLESIKAALSAVLTAPQFLFLVEESSGPEAERLNEYELATKLSYFLWDGPPDPRLLRLAGSGKLYEQLDAEITRLVEHGRFRRFVDAFATQWLRLDKLDVVEVDRKRYPRLTRDVRIALRDEPVRFLEHALRANLPLTALLDTNVIVANEIVAGYYGLSDGTETGFDFAPIVHERKSLGGLLSHAGVLAALSDGRESNPVKRGAWFARKIIAEPPADPPPNVPDLDESGGEHLTLRERLEQHRNQEGCSKCHEGIDPWGIPFEEFDAGGLLKRGAEDSQHASSTLPDGTEVDGVGELKEYLLTKRFDSVAFSVLKHLTTYAIGRRLSYREVAQLRAAAREMSSGPCRLQDMLRYVVRSDMFLTK